MQSKKYKVKSIKYQDTSIKRLVVGILWMLAMVSCGTLKKQLVKHDKVILVDSAAAHHAQSQNITMVSGDSVVNIPESFINTDFVIRAFDSCIDDCVVDSAETQDMKVLVTTTAGKTQRGIWIPASIKIKALRKAQKIYPNYNYVNISTMTETDSATKITATKEANSTITKSRDTRLTAIACIVLAICVTGVGWMITRLINRGAIL